MIGMEGEKASQPNFNVSMQYVDWDGIWAWWRERQMTKEQTLRLFPKPEGKPEWAAPEAMKKENAALQEICSRPNVTCTVGRDPMVFPEDD